MPSLHKLKIGDWVNIIESDRSYIEYGAIYAAQVISISKNSCIVDVSTTKEKIHKKISKSKIVHIFNL